MSMKGKINETLGTAEEEIGEMMGSEKMAWEGRAKRNKGRIEDGKMPKLTTPGSGHSEKED